MHCAFTLYYTQATYHIYLCNNNKIERREWEKKQRNYSKNDKNAIEVCSIMQNAIGGDVIIICAMQNKPKVEPQLFTFGCPVRWLDTFAIAIITQAPLYNHANHKYFIVLQFYDRRQ